LDKKKACSPDKLRLTVPGLTCNDGVYCSVIEERSNHFLQIPGRTRHEGIQINAFMSGTAWNLN
jgi:hypothetical protein